MKWFITALSVCLATGMTGAAATEAPGDMVANAKAADKVVVAVVEDVQPRFAANEFGDRLIVSQVWLRIEETLKGTPQALVSVDVEGGTLGDLTLRVSDLPVLKTGERGVFFLSATGSGSHKPHARGAGILKLDASDRLVGKNIHLSDVKAAVKTSVK